MLKHVKEMPRRTNEIAVKWIESKYARKTNHAVQVEHVLGGSSRSWAELI